MFGYLIHDIKRFLNDVWRELEFFKNFSIFVEFFQNNIIYFLRSEKQLVELEVIDSSNMKKFVKVLRRKWIERDPLKLNNGVSIHPF